MNQAIVVVLLSLPTCGCLNLYGALLAPTPKILFVSVAVVPKPAVEKLPTPYLKIAFSSDIDLQEMTNSRNLNTEILAYRCNSESDLAPAEFNPALLAYDIQIRDPDNIPVQSFSETASTHPATYHAYVNVAWPWNPPVKYDLREKPDGICLRVEAGTGLEMGNLISYRIASNTLFISAEKVQRALAEFTAGTPR